MLNERAIRWLEERHLDPELAAKLGIESCRGPGGGEELKIPYLVGSEAVNHKYRGIGEKTHRQDAKATKCFWNFNAICDTTLEAEPLIVTEGEWDAIAAIQAGFARVVSVPDGAPKEPIGDAETTKYAYFDHARSALKDVREIILATDSDEPGIALMHDLALRLGRARCKWLRYPKGCKDLNEALIRFGERGVQETIKRAQWCRVDGIYRMSELPPIPEREAFRTGMAFLDPHYRIRMGDFCVVTGVPSHGKTSFVNDLVSRAAAYHGWTVAIASFEQHPQADHRRTLREWHGRKWESQLTAEERAAADAFIERHFVFIVPDDEDLANLAWVLEKAAAAVIRHGARILVIDPWNELDHDRPAEVSLTEYTGRAIKEFKRLAKNLNVHVIVVAHPTKLQKGERPSLYSISDSAHWANKPDVGIVIWKDDPEAFTAECAVVKSRYHDRIGRPGKVPVEYLPRERRFFGPGEPVGQADMLGAA